MENWKQTNRYPKIDNLSLKYSISDKSERVNVKSVLMFFGREGNMVLRMLLS